MKIAYKHLLELIPEKPSIQDLSDRLFQLGHEHNIENDIFDMEFTPNRGDCLSLLGLSRDLNVFYKTDFNFSLYKKEIPDFDLNFINNATEKCTEISFLHIEIEGDIAKYKGYLESYFKDLKINKNNFFTDVSNYVAYEMGQPTHSYDLNKINTNMPLILDDNKGVNKFTSLLEKEIILNDPDLVFTNNNKVINLAGIMGSIETCCNQNTTNVLIECAYFKPEAIIGRSIKYDLHTDASHKFERGVDPLCQENVLRRIINIIDDHSTIKKVEVYFDKDSSFKKTELDIDVYKINNILGIDITEDDYKHHLRNLGFIINTNIIVPSFRSDINSQNDLAEEIARAIGYDNIKSSQIKIPKKVVHDKDFNLMDNQIRSLLIDHGFYEVINSPFVSYGNETSVKVDNPLDSNRSFLRKNITDSLLQNLIFNEKRQKDSIKLFEISDLYSSNNPQKKIKKIALIASGRVGKNYKDFSRKIDIDYLYSILNVTKSSTLDIKTISREKLDTKIKSTIVGLEINIDDLPKAILEYKSISKHPSEYVKYNPISEFPSTYRDVSYSVTDFNKLKELQHMVLTFEDIDIKDIFIFDFFENKKLGVIKVGFRFIFQSNIKTMTDNDVDKIMSKILTISCSIDGIQIPGMS